ncbi:MAG: dihydrofolate reductase family protein [Marinosulfonomonas sp.]
MTTGHMFMAMSLDGFITRPDDGLDWLMKQKTEGEDHGYDAFMASVDGLVMGSGSFRNALSFGAWPYEKPVVVLSQTLAQQDIPKDLQDKVRISRQSPQELMNSLSEQGWERAYIDGGKIIQSFLRDGLVVDMSITIVPILIGDGKRMFGALKTDLDLELLESNTFPSGLVNARYRVL